MRLGSKEDVDDAGLAKRECSHNPLAAIEIFRELMLSDVKRRANTQFDTSAADVPKSVTEARSGAVAEFFKRDKTRKSERRVRREIEHQTKVGAYAANQTEIIAEHSPPVVEEDFGCLPRIRESDEQVKLGNDKSGCFGFGLSE